GHERIFIVHNGIIDNARDLRLELEADGVELTSDTDTEAVAHLIARSGAETLEDAVRQTLHRLSGTYALAVIDTEHPDRIVVARN
ncbi:glutamine--fructose-6-phosphate transaminase (isomerizing), partial [Mycobacterium kansasii]